MPRRDMTKPSLSQAPEVLSTEDEDQLGSGPVDVQSAVQHAIEQDDTPTIFFVNVTPGELPADASKELQRIQGYIREWQSYASSMSEAQVQRLVKAHQLPSDTDGQFARGTYRAKVVDYLIRKTPCFDKEFDQTMRKEIRAEIYQFHIELLNSVTEGFGILTPPAYIHLERVLAQISDSVTWAGLKQGEANMQFFVMLTKFTFEPISQLVRTKIRVITSRTTRETAQFLLAKKQYSSIEMNLVFGQYDAEFNEKTWEGIRDSFDEKLFEKGKDLANKRTVNIEAHS